MKRITYFIFTFLSLFGMMLQSCTDEIEYPNGGQELPMRDGITLRIPSTKGMTVSSTRAISDVDLDQTMKEGEIHNLYIIAFNGNNVIKKPLSDGDAIQSDDLHDNAQGYKDFDLTSLFKEAGDGLWKIYVAANIDAYLPDGKTLSNTTIEKEEDLTGLKLNFFSESEGAKRYLLDPELTKENGHGLPMICLASEMLVKYKSDEEFKPADGGVSISSSTNALLHADLSFLCSKVRYTLLFDNTTFSKDIFEGKSWNLTAVGASNIFDQPYTLNRNSNSSASSNILSNISFKEKNYPSDPDTYPTDDEAFIDNLGDAGEGAYDKRCFQGVFYFPANEREDKLTTLSFTAQEQHRENSSVKNGAPLYYKMNLLPKEVDYSNGMKHAHAYDIVAKVTGLQDIEAQVEVVQNWTACTLTYSLMPPTYLKVDKTVVDMVAGSHTEIEYSTNADAIDIEGPTVEVNGKQVQLYKLIKNEDGKIYVAVNSEVPVSAYDQIDTNDEKYHEFYIIAGNIRKKIDIENLSLQRFLTVDPINITIDAREKIASGEYSGFIDVTIRTNLDKIYLNTGDKDASGNPIRQWYTITKGKSNCLSLVNATNGDEAYWQNNNDQITLTGADIKDGVIRLKINFANINKNGETFWNNSKILSFEVSCDNEGEPGPGYIFPEKVTVNLLPNNDNYTIYFKDNDNWTDPHIYVYQCLELPMSKGSTPVGYYIDKGKDNENANAALEYLFSGGVMFKGWDYGANRTSLNSMNGTMAYGFYIFDGSDDKSNWNPGSEKGNERYYTDLDFNAAHRATGICQRCKDEGINNGWPGIGLHKVTPEEDPDNAGWWKYELSGLATPGKALLMFNDGHEDNYTRRYPQSGENGIPLFDYPNRIGYIDLTYTHSEWKPNGNNGQDEHRRYNSTISQTSSGGTTEDGISTIYFTNPNNWSTVYVYMWDEARKSGANGAWGTIKMTKINNNLWSYVVPSNKKYDKVIFYDGTSDKVGEHKTTNLDVSSQYDTYNMDGAFKNTSNNGGGNGGDTSDYVTYRYYWYKTYSNVTREYIHVYDLPSGTKKGNVTLEQGKTYYRDDFNSADGFCYFEFKVPKANHDSGFTWNFILHEAENSWNNRIDLSMKSGDFSKNASTGIYELKKTTGY